LPFALHMFLFILLFLVKSVGKFGLFCGILKFEKIFRGWINTINKKFEICIGSVTNM
jgi:hypothetical protein